MQYITHSHSYGSEAVPTDVSEPLLMSIYQLDPTYADSGKLRSLVLGVLKTQGWSQNVRVADDSQITITAMRGRIGLCLQTGNMSRFYADLVKLQYLFLNDSIIGAMFVLQTRQRAQKAGSNIANFERLTEELTLFKHVYTVPTLVIGID